MPCNSRQRAQTQGQADDPHAAKAAKLEKDVRTVGPADPARACLVSLLEALMSSTPPLSLFPSVAAGLPCGASLCRCGFASIWKRCMGTSPAIRRNTWKEASLKASTETCWLQKRYGIPLWFRFPQNSERNIRPLWHLGAALGPKVRQRTERLGRFLRWCGRRLASRPGNVLFGEMGKPGARLATFVALTNSHPCSLPFPCPRRAS